MKKLFLIVGLLLFVWLGYRAWYSSALKPVDVNDTEKIELTIPEGASLSKAADILKLQGVIRSPSAFARLARSKGLSSKVQAGTFVLQPSMAAEEVLSILTASEEGQLSVTIPEGFTVKDIDQLLAEKGITEAGEILTCARTCDFSKFSFLPHVSGLAERGGKLEGYLFPDTYFISTDATPQSFMNRLLQTFQTKVLDPHPQESAIQSSGHSLHEIVTMASLIEEETRTDAERPVVSGILWKRLREGMRLDVDAAVRYVLNKPSSQITQSDLESDSPYNLRRAKGLPPGPIANPSLKSIDAALHPQESEYYYYLHGTDGQVRYAKTNDEHNANRAKYLR